MLCRSLPQRLGSPENWDNGTGGCWLYCRRRATQLDHCQITINWLRSLAKGLWYLARTSHVSRAAALSHRLFGAAVNYFVFLLKRLIETFPSVFCKARSSLVIQTHPEHPTAVNYDEIFERIHLRYLQMWNLGWRRDLIGLYSARGIWKEFVRADQCAEVHLGIVRKLWKKTARGSSVKERCVMKLGCQTPPLWTDALSDLPLLCETEMGLGWPLSHRFFWLL